MKLKGSVFISLLSLVATQEPQLRGLESPSQQRTLIFDYFADLFGFGNKQCPPEGFGALENFDIDSYISARWYVQKQIPVSYLPLEEFYCTTADYTPYTGFCFFCFGARQILIANRARKGSVTGPRVGEADGSDGNKFFRGIVRKPVKKPAEVSVGFVPDLLQFTSNYWIVAAGTYQDALDGKRVPTSNQYDWAIISGGPAKKNGANGKCKPDPGILNFLGMWMFTRDGVPPAGVVEAIDGIADSMGLDTTAWLPVEQEGCI